MVEAWKPWARKLLWRHSWGLEVAVSEFRPSDAWRVTVPSIQSSQPGSCLSNSGNRMIRFHGPSQTNYSTTPRRDDTVMGSCRERQIDRRGSHGRGCPNFVAPNFVVTAAKISNGSLIVHWNSFAALCTLSYPSKNIKLIIIIIIRASIPLLNIARRARL